MRGDGFRRYVLTAHAISQAERRRIDLATIRAVLAAPEQRLTIRPGRVVLQSRLRSASAEPVHLLRIVVDVDRSPAEVVTVYRTGQVLEYWESTR
jgi:hypothetical protein